jgi:hypothetical protein
MVWWQFSTSTGKTFFLANKSDESDDFVSDTMQKFSTSFMEEHATSSYGDCIIFC